MIELSAASSNREEEFFKWRWVKEIIMDNLTDEMKTNWQDKGYEGLFKLVPKHFGMTRMYRKPTSYVTFEFTEEQWTMFLLRWM